MANNYGWMQVTFHMPCDLKDINPNQQWISKLLLTNPDLTGWPFFVDLWNARKPEFKPIFKNGIWEAKIVHSADDFGGIDYWKIDARNGLFYAARALEDDTSPNSPNKFNTLEFALAILRVVEIIYIAVQFAKYLCTDDQESNENILFQFKWTGLNNRVISNWADRMRLLYGDYTCHTDSVEKTLEIPVTCSKDQVSVYSKIVLDELFLHFDGWTCSPKAMDELAGTLLYRKL